MLAALIPTMKRDPMIDLYGPFWIPTTVIFSLFATSTVAASIVKAIEGSVFAAFITGILMFLI